MSALSKTLAQLAARWGDPAAPVPTLAALDLNGEGVHLLGATDAKWLAALARAHFEAGVVERALGELAGGGAATATTGAEVARAAAASFARAHTGRTRIVCAGVRPPDGGIACAVEAVGAELDRGGVAACIIEPVDAEALRALRARADRDGFLLIADETRTAHRVAAGLAHRAFGVRADLAFVGPSLAGGLPFGALLGAEPMAPLPAPSRTAAAAAVATLARLRAAPVVADLAALGARLRARFAASCARENIDAELEGPDALLRFRFRGQENAEAPLMELHFGYELARVGVAPGRGYVLPCLDHDPAALDALGDAIDRATARMRCLLIEHNSWLSGGVPFVFPGADPAVADRGLAWYRFPARAAVDLSAEADCVRIAFRGGPLGEVTSSGFYLPTVFTGDFDVRADYRIHAWEPGPDSACLGLFAQNLASSHRYYAQRMSDGSAPDAHRVLGSHASALSPARPVTVRAGSLRITRRGRALTTWHKAPGDADWTALATDAHATADDVVFGAKIWSKVASGRIEATVHALAIDARMAREQVPRLEPRPDPR